LEIKTFYGALSVSAEKVDNPENTIKREHFGYLDFYGKIFIN
jgi:hypothetical protein